MACETKPTICSNGGLSEEEEEEEEERGGGGEGGGGGEEGGGITIALISFIILPSVLYWHWVIIDYMYEIFPTFYLLVQS